MTKKKTLVIGASDNPERYSYMAINSLRIHGHPVVAIGKKAVKIADVTADAYPAVHNEIDTVTMYVGPKHQKEYYDYLIALKPKRIIFNPGTENEELANLAKSNGIQAIEACTLVMLSTGQF
jgi:uncharacterized protein